MNTVEFHLLYTINQPYLKKLIKFKKFLIAPCTRIILDFKICCSVLLLTPNFCFLAQPITMLLHIYVMESKEKKVFIVLTGEVGCGKTTLCRKLLSELSPEKYETALTEPTGSGTPIA